MGAKFTIAWVPPFAFLALSDRGLRLPRRYLHLLKQLRWHRMVQATGDGHGALALVGDVGGGAEEGGSLKGEG